MWCLLHSPDQSRSSLQLEQSRPGECRDYASCAPRLFFYITCALTPQLMTQVYSHVTCAFISVWSYTSFMLQGVCLLTSLVLQILVKGTSWKGWLTNTLTEQVNIPAFQILLSPWRLLITAQMLIHCHNVGKIKFYWVKWPLSVVRSCNFIVK